MAKKWLLGVVLLANLIGLIFPLHHDEHIFFIMSEQVTWGNLPYQEYFDHKPPGIYYLLAGEILLFGKQLLWARILVLLANLITATGIYLIGQRWGRFMNRSYRQSQEIGFTAAVTYLGTIPLYQGTFVLTQPFMNLFIVASISQLLHFTDIKRGKTLRVWWAGIYLSMATLFRQTAIVFVLPWLIFIIFYSSIGTSALRKAKETRRTPPSPPSPRGGILGATSLFMLGVIFPWVAVAVFFYIQGTWHDFYFAVVTFNLTQYAPWPLPETLSHLPMMLIPAAGVWLAAGIIVTRFLRGIRKFRNQSCKNDWLWTGYLVISILVSLPIILTRPYHHYWLQVLPFVALLLGLHVHRMFLTLQLVKLNLVLACLGFIIYGLWFE